MYLSIVGLASLFFLSLSQLCSFGGKLASACFIFICYEWKASLNVIWFEHQTIAFPGALERRMSKVFFSPLLPQWTILICKVIIESERCQQYRNIYIYIYMQAWTSSYSSISLFKISWEGVEEKRSCSFCSCYHHGLLKSHANQLHLWRHMTMHDIFSLCFGWTSLITQWMLWLWKSVWVLCIL